MSLLTQRETEVLNALLTRDTPTAALHLGITRSAIESCKSRVRAKIREAPRVRRKYRMVLYKHKKKGG